MPEAQAPCSRRMRPIQNRTRSKHSATHFIGVFTLFSFPHTNSSSLSLPQLKELLQRFLFCSPSSPMFKRKHHQNGILKPNINHHHRNLLQLKFNIIFNESESWNPCARLNDIKRFKWTREENLPSWMLYRGGSPAKTSMNSFPFLLQLLRFLLLLLAHCDVRGWDLNKGEDFEEWNVRELNNREWSVLLSWWFVIFAICDC